MVTKTLSLEDRDLQNVAKISSTGQSRYSDLDLSFVKKKNGDIFKKNDASSIKQAVKNLILTNYYEKPFQPFFGTNIQSLLFELADDFIEDDIKEEISDSLNAYEPRVRLLDVESSFNGSQNSLNVRIVFRIINTGELVTIETEISRLR